MRRIINNIFLILLSLIILSCVHSERIEPQTNSISEKIINSPTPTTKNILVKIAENGGTKAINDLKVAGVDSVKRVFRSLKGKEAMEKEFGLDRWYEIFVNPQNIDTKGGQNGLNEIAQLLAEVEEIAVIQYNTNVEQSNREVIPFNPSFVTKSDMPYSGNTFFNDPHLQNQWHLINTGSSTIDVAARKGADINIFPVWQSITTGDPEIIVAVIDDGVDYTHPDLKNNMWVNEAELNGSQGVDDDNNGYIDDIYGYNCFQDKGEIVFDNPQSSGHGTHCAGVIAAENNNGIGVCGVAGGSGKGDACKVMSVQIFSGDDGGSSSQIAQAFVYAANNGASIASCSWGNESTLLTDSRYENECTIEYDAIRYFEATKNNSIIDGGLIIFAAGNASFKKAQYPGAYHDFISVVATGADGLPTHYTNYGPGCNIAAPGGEKISSDSPEGMVLSTIPPDLFNGMGYGYKFGTSMACPQVAGIVALGISYAKRLGKHYSLDEYKHLILTSTTDIEGRLTGNKITNKGKESLLLSNFKGNFGTGLINAVQLIDKIDGIPSIIAKVGENQWLDVSQYFGGSSKNLTYLSVEVISSSLDLAEEPYMLHGRLYVHPQKVGSAKLRISAISGGTFVGGGSNTGGQQIEQVISIVSKYNISSNGGWL